MLVSGFIVGLMGSVHCLGMCGPIAMILPVSKTNGRKRILQIILYHLGRLLSYSLLGLFFGLLGQSINLFSSQQYLSIGIGALMVISVFIPYRISSSLQKKGPIHLIIRWVSKKLGGLLKEGKQDRLLSLGFLNGLLPCGLVYVAIGSAITLADPLTAALYMALFGLGTVPMMTSAIYLSKWISAKTRTKLLKWIPVVIFLMGVLLILRGLGLGIKFVSPPVEVSQPKVSAIQSCH